MKRTLWIGVFLMIGTILGVWAEEYEYDITFVGTVEDAGDVLMVRIEEVLATNAERVCETVEVKGEVSGFSVGETVHVRGHYDDRECVVAISAEDHFIYGIPAGAELEKLDQTLQFTGEITRIYEMRGETFCDILVDEVIVVTYQEQDMCTTVTVKIKPVVGEVEEGFEPGDEVEFSGSYEEETCSGSLGWHDDYLRKKKRAGVSWILILGGFACYLVLRKIW